MAGVHIKRQAKVPHVLNEHAEFVFGRRRLANKDTLIYPVSTKLDIVFVREKEHRVL